MVFGEPPRENETEKHLKELQVGREIIESPNSSYSGNERKERLGMIGKQEAKLLEKLEKRKSL